MRQYFESNSTNRQLQQFKAFMAQLIEKGGPVPDQYPELDQWLFRIFNELDEGRICKRELSAFWKDLNPEFLNETLQGFAFRKPHGFTGDFEVVDRVYQRSVSSTAKWVKWDKYTQQSETLSGIRGRKDYFNRLIYRLEERHSGEMFTVLNLGSGSGRDMYDYLADHNSHKAMFDCVDPNPGAIAFAKDLCVDFRNRIRFCEQSILRFKPSRKYNLIWSAGVFDFYNKNLFGLVLKRLLHSLESGGELVIGNISRKNASRYFIESVGDWLLHYRSEEDLRDLAISNGIPDSAIEIGREPRGVNLFLHIRSKWF